MCQKDFHFHRMKNSWEIRNTCQQLEISLKISTVDNVHTIWIFKKTDTSKIHVFEYQKYSLKICSIFKNSKTYKICLIQ